MKKPILVYFCHSCGTRVSCLFPIGDGSATLCYCLNCNNKCDVKEPAVMCFTHKCEVKNGTSKLESSKDCR